MEDTSCKAVAAHETKTGWTVPRHAGEQTVAAVGDRTRGFVGMETVVVIPQLVINSAIFVASEVWVTLFSGKRRSAANDGVGREYECCFTRIGQTRGKHRLKVQVAHTFTHIGPVPFKGKETVA